VFPAAPKARKPLPHAFQKGRAKTGGRKKGGPYRALPAAAKVAKEEIAAAMLEPNKMGPLALILCAMQIRWARGDMDGAVTYAEKAINFTNAKLTSTEVNVQHSLAARSEQDILNELEQLQVKLALASMSALPAAPVIEGQLDQTSHPQKISTEITPEDVLAAQADQEKIAQS
jgi:hypothetical protein